VIGAVSKDSREFSLRQPRRLLDHHVHGDTGTHQRPRTRFLQWLCHVRHVSDAEFGARCVNAVESWCIPRSAVLLYT
jgi:hypothetical protein